MEEQTRMMAYETLELSGLPMMELQPGRDRPQQDSWRTMPPATSLAMRTHLKAHGGNVGIRTGPVFGAERNVVALAAKKGADLPDLLTWRIQGPQEILLFKSPDICPTTIKLKDGLMFIGSNGYIPGPGTKIGHSIYSWARGPKAPGSVLADLPEEILEDIRRQEYIQGRGAARKEKAPDLPEHEKNRTDIIVHNNILVCVDAAEELLAKTYTPTSRRAVFQRAGKLVMVRGKGDSFSAKDLSGPTVRELLSGAARWSFGDGRQILPPTEIISALLQRGSWDEIPHLDHVMTSPMMLESGDVLLERGYHPSHKTWCEFDPEPYLAHKRPQRGPEEARKSAQVLLTPFQDFPFRHDYDKASLLALILTIVGREMIEGEVPVFGIRSPVRGTGKTLLGRAACMIGTGDDPALQQQITSPEEVRKNLFASAINGDRIVFFDNEEGDFGSTVLSSCVTSGFIEDRVLGHSQKRRLPWKAVVLVSGNNLRFKKDQARRTVTIDLDAMLERPESRDLTSFAFCPLLPHIRKHREQLFMLAAHILESHALSGRPRMVEQGLGGFESWDSCIRQAVCWAIGSDPLHKRFKRDEEETDAEAEKIVTFMLQWKKHVGLETLVRCVDLVGTTNDTFREILRDFVGHERPFTAQNLGQALYQIMNRPLSKLSFRKRKTRGYTYWFLQKLGADPIQLRQQEIRAAKEFLEEHEDKVAEAQEQQHDPEGFIDEARESG